ncbi:hypothetical protein OAF34_00245 [Pirellulaceae bacterium]|jgi:hypothetical protein|nr:hypothetical protein [Pirellulaceae bacterium]
MMMAKAAKAGLKVADFIGQASATTTELAWLIEMLPYYRCHEVILVQPEGGRNAKPVDKC